MPVEAFHNEWDQQSVQSIILYDGVKKQARILFLMQTFVKQSHHLFGIRAQKCTEMMIKIVADNFFFY